MLILGIETSCDDTGIAIVEATPTRKAAGVNFKIPSNVISSQIKTHAPFGGVVPNLAAREHLKNIGPCLKTALKESNKTIREIDLIVVTVGPGLIPSLLIGVHFAKALAYKYSIPIVGVNHLNGHIMAGLFSKSIISKSKIQISNQIQMTKFQKLFPVIALLVSGGHTQLVLMKRLENYKIIGETRDDAAGECFDKVAKLLRLPYPGGPEIAKQAAKVISNFQFLISNQIPIYKLPRPMIAHRNYDFSFSGLKTAVLYTIRDNKKINIPEMCKEAQQAIIDVLIDKTLRAAKEYKAKTIILSGGVAANEELRRQFGFEIKNSKLKIQFLTPVKNLCMDNGVMIAMAGYSNRKTATKNYYKLKADANLRLS